MILGSLCAVFAAIIAFEFFVPALDVGQSVAAIPARSTETATVMPPRRGAESIVAAILDRPLFDPSRRPPVIPAPPEVAEDEPEVEQPPELEGRLAGVVLRPGVREALFTRAGDVPLAVNEGDEIDGWTVASIQLDHVVLRSGFGE